MVVSADDLTITFILASLKGGGIQKATLRLIREFLRMGIPTRLITIDSSGPMRLEIPHQCDWVALNSRRTRWALWKLVTVLKHNKPQVIISAQTHLNVLVIVARALSGFPKKLLVVEHITFNEELVTSGCLYERIRPWLIRIFYPFSDKMIAVSPDSVRSIYQYSRTNMTIDMIRNGLDIDEIQQRASQPVSHPWLIGQNRHRVIVGMGRLTTQKNFSALLEAFAELEAVENYRLIILGEGPEYASLRALANDLGIQNFVDFPGFVQNPYPFLARADLFVLSSLWEGFANVVIEALACGKPIVATDCPGGPADILGDQTFARIVPLDNPQAMTLAMHTLLSMAFDPSEIRGYANQFSIQKAAASYLALIRDIEDGES